MTAADIAVLCVFGFVLAVLAYFAFVFWRDDRGPL